MKTLLLALLMTCSTTLWAASKISCKMHSRGNQAELLLTIEDQKAIVQIDSAEPDACELEPNPDYSTHIRCGSGEDAMYFAVSGPTGKVYASFGTVATLKSCRLI